MVYCLLDVFRLASLGSGVKVVIFIYACIDYLKRVTLVEMDVVFGYCWCYVWCVYVGSLLGLWSYRLIRFIPTLLWLCYVGASYDFFIAGKSRCSSEGGSLLALLIGLFYPSQGVLVNVCLVSWLVFLSSLS